MTSDGDELLRSFLTGVPESEPQTDRILDAALRSFETYGPRRTTMDDVARESGLGRATIYRRFPTKGDLVTGVLLREARRFFAELDEAVAALPTLEERLVEGFAVALRISREQRLVTRLMVVEPELILPHSTVKAGPLLAAARGYLAGRAAHRAAPRRRPAGRRPGGGRRDPRAAHPLPRPHPGGAHPPRRRRGPRLRPPLPAPDRPQHPGLTPPPARRPRRDR
ncbi:TetR/AcrR family transcriptional regulator [Actinomadura madurae]|uniref:TetR/AcrR family transcriptional regulator n=1 Tax=Actinomadura madurae TaxID=1993 RepID=UPI0020D2312F|nr:TetR/AcrR family transcriptional regulator [Actinomadura madurae]MCP9976309.1 TetR/AcrR family transcriptional regulator [Actinomadura madurae]